MRAGAIYTSCYSLGFCERAMKMTIGVPITSGSRSEVISLVGNTAAGYGSDMASAPAKITIVNHGQQYVPGYTPLDITFSLEDATGASVMGSEHIPIAHLIQLLVLPVDAACSTFAACERQKMQPVESFLSSGMQKTTSILRDVVTHKISLKYCQVGVADVQLRLFLSTGDELDVTGAKDSDLMTLQASAVVSCLPCVSGWAREQVFTTQFLQGLWTCRLG